MIDKRVSAWVAAAIVVAFVPANAGAAVVDFDFDGTVTTSEQDKGSFFGGLEAGDTVTVAGSFDDSVLAGDGSGTIDFTSSNNDTNVFTITAGTLTYEQSDDDFYSASDGPWITLDSGGDLSDFTFSSTADVNDDGDSDEFDSFFLDFNGGTDNKGATLMSGDWNADSFSTTSTVVPVPAAVWLFGSGLIALGGLARRRKA